jgi:hypothetical protein
VWTSSNVVCGLHQIGGMFMLHILKYLLTYVYVCAEENNFLNCCSIIYFVSGDRVLRRIFGPKGMR